MCGFYSSSLVGVVVSTHSKLHRRLRGLSSVINPGDMWKVDRWGRGADQNGTLPATAVSHDCWRARVAAKSGGVPVHRHRQLDSDWRAPARTCEGTPRHSYDAVEQPVCGVGADKTRGMLVRPRLYTSRHLPFRPRALRTSAYHALSALYINTLCGQIGPPINRASLSVASQDARHLFPTRFFKVEPIFQGHKRGFYLCHIYFLIF